MPRIEMGKKYRTRDGREAQIICVDGPDKSYPVIAAIYHGSGTWDPDDFTVNGRNVTNEEHAEDLIEVKPEIKGWVNLYPSMAEGRSNTINAVKNDGYWYPTRERADIAAAGNRLACIPVTFREGDGLEDLCK